MDAADESKRAGVRGKRDLVKMGEGRIKVDVRGVWNNRCDFGMHSGSAVRTARGADGRARQRRREDETGGMARR